MDIGIISSFLVLEFKSLVYFAFTLASGGRSGRGILLPVVVQFSQRRVLGRPPFPPLSVLGSHVKDWWTVRTGVFLGSHFCHIGLRICFYASTVLF